MNPILSLSILGQSVSTTAELEKKKRPPRPPPKPPISLDLTNKVLLIPLEDSPFSPRPPLPEPKDSKNPSPRSSLGSSSGVSNDPLQSPGPSLTPSPRSSLPLDETPLPASRPMPRKLAVDNLDQSWDLDSPPGSAQGSPTPTPVEAHSLVEALDQKALSSPHVPPGQSEKSNPILSNPVSSEDTKILARLLPPLGHSILRRHAAKFPSGMAEKIAALAMQIAMDCMNERAETLRDLGLTGITEKLPVDNWRKPFISQLRQHGILEGVFPGAYFKMWNGLLDCYDSKIEADNKLIRIDLGRLLKAIEKAQTSVLYNPNAKINEQTLLVFASIDGCLLPSDKAKVDLRFDILKKQLGRTPNLAELYRVFAKKIAGSTNQQLNQLCETYDAKIVWTSGRKETCSLGVLAEIAPGLSRHTIGKTPTMQTGAQEIRYWINTFCKGHARILVIDN
jgi:hypothetical protein